MGLDGAWSHGFMIAFIREPRFRLGLEPIVSNVFARLSTGQNALDIGTPHALLVLARDGCGGCPQGRTAPLTPWPRGTCREQIGHGCLDS